MTTTECQRTTGWRQRATNIRHHHHRDDGRRPSFTGRIMDHHRRGTDRHHR